ncbi:Uncharacterised protein [Vibrio cholerae]|nr:Uncharacterised protein [Vibrio cholerae]
MNRMPSHIYWVLDHRKQYLYQITDTWQQKAANDKFA